MLYKDAIIKRDSMLNLIGTKDKKGFIISDIIIVPLNEQDCRSFVQNFVVNRNYEVSLQPYINGEVVLWAIDTEHLDNANILFYDVLG